ncbi:PIG-L deacetylase family protein [Salinicola salarius]|uniref:PIG-L deacetylase family protein n=1 Tax=Salinicola salarius TaxID=430457 RepID=UPI000B3FA7D8|nr:PIG-L family deacetylase [Salinicola salarius]
MSLERFFTPYQADTRLPGDVVAVLAPHPDDEVFGCGGTLHALAAAGAELHIAVISDGAGLGQDAALARQRRAESCEAARCLGYPPPEFWELPDARLYEHPALQPRIDAWLAEVQPTLLLAPSIWEMHRDHRAVAEAALSSEQRPAHCRVALYEVGQPLQPNRLVDITAQREAKQRAMRCFASQLAVQAYDRHISGLNAFRTYTLPIDILAAEAFCLLEPEEVAPFLASRQPQAITRVVHEAERAEQATAHRQEALEAELRELRGDNTRLAERCRDLEAMQRAIQQSRSWQLTRPLRWLAERWRGN